MRFTMIGHAAVYLETSGPSILLDPWLIGSAFYRSWWHYPPTPELRPEWLHPDYLYITHLHFDHLHYPSLRKLDRNTRVLLPRFGIDVMQHELAGLGFPHVEELPHGKIIHLTKKVRIASYQYGFDDTCVVIADGDHVICNSNDAKIKGRALDQIVRDFGHPTFLWKNHSYSITYPLCYEAQDPEDLNLVTRESFSEDFIEVTRVLKPRYAVPFASSIAFLHPESFEHNAGAISPGEIKQAFDAADGLDGSECVMMSPGDTWDSETGFELDDTDWDEGRLERLAAMQKELEPKILGSPVEGPDRTLDFEVFRAYLEEFCRVLPPLVARLLLRRPIVFAFEDGDTPFWIVDFVRGRVTRSGEMPPDWASRVTADAGMTADMIDKAILCNLVGTMRIHVELAPGGVSTDLAFWGLLMVWENRYLPMHRVMNLRFVQTLFARRREAYDQVAALLSGTGSPLRRLSQGFTPSTRHGD